MINAVNDSAYVLEAIIDSDTVNNGDLLTVQTGNGGLAISSIVVLSSGQTTAQITLDLSALPDGTVALELVTSDLAGNSSTFRQTLVKDTVVPFISALSSLALNSNNQSSYPISMSFINAEAGDLVEVTLHGSPVISTTRALTNIELNGLQVILQSSQIINNGMTTLTVQISDQAGNSSSQSVVIAHDTIIPDASGVRATVSADNFGGLMGVISVAFTGVSSDVTGVQIIISRTTGVEIRNVFSTKTNIVILENIPVETILVVSANALDAAGNSVPITDITPSIIRIEARDTKDSDNDGLPNYLEDPDNRGR